MNEQAAWLGDRHQVRVAVQDFKRRITAYWQGQRRRGAVIMTSSERGQGGTGGASAFTRVRRLPELARYERRVIHEILDAATHCHVAHLIDGRPVATPTLHFRIGERVYWHGSVASRMLKAIAAGAEVCLTATIIDGWVLARSAFNHSANYRSVMCFGKPAPIHDPAEKTRLLRIFTEQLFPGRWRHLRPVTRKELGATVVMSLPLSSASAKVRVGPPDDPPRDRDWPVWAGVIPLAQRAGRPIPDDGLPAGLAGLPRPKPARRGRRPR
jgi:nitroimidazol reductase NimA-like FMN-containing flavoprotein (pyridoxamine 5'-phosphate oxidase superfamily)